MHVLLPLLSLLGIEAEEIADRVKKNAVAWSVVAFFALVFIVFALVALNAWLAELFGPIIAALMIAGGALLLALVAYGLLAASEARARRREAERRSEAEKTALVTTAALTALPMLMSSPLMRRVGIPVGSVLAAAYLLRRPGGGSDARPNGHDPG